MRTETRTIYTLAELKSAHPDAYAKVHARWAESVYADGAPWAEEVQDSLRCVVEACGGTINHRGTAEADDCRDTDDGETLKDAAWLIENVLAPSGYAPEGVPTFPGLCKWTGYCADDDMIESVYEDMAGGMTLQDALRSLDNVAQRHAEDDLEQMADEESMHANWDGREYDAEGNPA